MSVKKVAASVNLLGDTVGIIFEAFILQKLVQKLAKGACVLMDNYSIHKVKEVENFIEAVGARVIYLPPYFHNFSQI